jgi:hypothetical protein
VNQGFAENGARAAVILSDAESGRDTGELRVEQLPTQPIAWQATPATLARDIVYLLVSSLPVGIP